MNIRPMTKSDFDYLQGAIDGWWGRPIKHILHPVYLYQFGNTAFMAEENDQIVGFLVGFVSQREHQEAYIHMVAVDPKVRKRGIARALYNQFFAVVAELGCQRVKAITLPINRISIAFHLHMGFQLIEDGTIDIGNVKAVKDYSGPGKHRVVFVKYL